MNKENFRRTVLFWFKKPSNNADRATFETSLKQFTDHSIYVQNKHIGVAPVSKRDVVDSSFTYCLTVSFLSKKDQDEPAHLKFIDTCSHLWDKVVVNDSISI